MSVDEAIQKALGDLYDNEHVVNFHKRVDMLPAWLGNSLKVIMGVGDMNFEYTAEGEQFIGRVGVELFSDYDVFVCLPEVWEGSPLRENLEYVINNGFQKKVICYLNIENPDQVSQFVALFEGRIAFINGYENHIPHFGIQSIERLLHVDGTAREVFEAYDRQLVEGAKYLTDIKNFFLTKVRTKTITPADALEGYGEVKDKWGGNWGWVDVNPHTFNFEEQLKILHFLTWTWRKLWEMSRESKKISLSKEIAKEFQEIFLEYKEQVKLSEAELDPKELDKRGKAFYRQYMIICNMFTYVIKSLVLGYLLPPQLVGQVTYVMNPRTSKVFPMLALKKIALAAASEGGFRRKRGQSRRTSRRSKVRKTRRS